MHRPIYMYMLYVDMSIVYNATTAMNIRIHCMLSMYAIIIQHVCRACIHSSIELCVLLHAYSTV